VFSSMWRIFEAARDQLNWAALEALLVAGEAAPASVAALAPVSREAPAAKVTTAAECVAEILDFTESKSERTVVQQQVRPIAELFKALPSIKGLSSGYMFVQTEVTNWLQPSHPPGGYINFALFRSRRWFE
jgi:hypothetical protein